MTSSNKIHALLIPHLNSNNTGYVQIEIFYPDIILDHIRHTELRTIETERLNNGLLENIKISEKKMINHLEITANQTKNHTELTNQALAKIQDTGNTLENYIAEAPGKLGNAIKEFASPIVQVWLPIIIAVSVAVAVCILLIVIGYCYVGKLKKNTKIAKWVGPEESGV